MYLKRVRTEVKNESSMSVQFLVYSSSSTGDV